MVLLYDGAFRDPRVRRLSPAAGVLWLAAISACNVRHRDTLDLDELRDAARPDTDVDACLLELVEANLARRLPHDHVRLEARLDLWAFDDEADADVVVGPPRDD